MNTCRCSPRLRVGTYCIVLLIFAFFYRSTCVVLTTLWAPIYGFMLAHYFYVCQRRSQWLVPSRCGRWCWQSKGLTQENVQRLMTYTILIVPKRNIYLWMKNVTRMFYIRKSGFKFMFRKWRHCFLFWII